MTDFDKHPHTETYPSYELVFWKGNRAANRADADRVQLVQFGYSGRMEVAEFKWPEREPRVQRWQWALERAVEHGKGLTQAEIKKALGL